MYGVEGLQAYVREVIR